MTADEKESVKYLKEYIKLGEKAIKYGVAISPRFRIILNLIEKQQKEIEELKHKYDKLLSDINKCIGKAIVDTNYVSKDKIRNKIKELDEAYDNVETDELGNKNFYCYDFIKELLNELLES